MWNLDDKKSIESMKKSYEDVEKMQGKQKVQRLYRGMHSQAAVSANLQLDQRNKMNFDE